MRAVRSLKLGLLAGVLLVGGLAACGEDGEDDASTTSAPSTTTVETTTSASATTGTTVPTTTTTGVTTTIAVVVAWIQAELDERYAESTPPRGMTGSSQLVCADTGSVMVGGVVACELRPQTEPGFDLEIGGVIVYVLDASGRAAFNVATDIPSSTEGLMADYASVPKGLYCRDLLDPDVDAYPFSQRSTPATNFLWSLVYWSLDGEPDRMDEDQNGVPCETLYDPDVIAQVLAGGSVS